MNYREWEKTQSFSPVSPEASAAEDAWDAATLAALDDAIEIAKRCRPEDTVQALCRLRDKTQSAA